MSSPHVYVQSDIPLGVTIAAWRRERRRQATPSRSPVSVCTVPGCPEFATYRGRCDAHGSDRGRPSAAARGYDSQWDRTRRAYLRAHPLCECGCQRPATDVHHVDGRGPSGPRGHDWSNLRALSHDCHSRETARDQPGGWNAR